MAQKINFTRQNLLIAGFKFPHHSNSSGYQQLAMHLPGKFLDADDLPFGKNQFGTSGHRINTIVTQLWIRAIASEYRLVHFLYPENNVVWHVPSRGTVSVATLHLPANWLNVSETNMSWRERLRRRAFQRVRGIITLSRDQVSIISNELPQTMVRFIPHGVAKQYPNKLEGLSKSEKFNILLTGTNFRDEKFFLEIARYALQMKPTWNFRLVGVNKNWRDNTAKLPNVKIMPFLSEEDYHRVIEESHILFLPLTFATANNALLEAHALGVPSVCSYLPGILDYSVGSTKHFKTVSEAIKMIEQIEGLSEEQYRNLRVDTYRQATKFYWPTIAQEVLNFYQDVLEQQR